MKSETYKNKAKEIKEKREKLKDCPRNAKKIAEMKAKEKRLRAKAKERKAAEENKSAARSDKKTASKPSIIKAPMHNNEKNVSKVSNENPSKGKRHFGLSEAKNNSSNKIFSERDKHKDICNYSSKMEGGWSVRIYTAGFATAMKDGAFIKGNSEEELLEKIKTYELKQAENTLREETDELRSESNALSEKINKNSVMISKLKSTILNSKLQDKTILDEQPSQNSKRLDFSVIYPNNLEDTNAQYKEIIEYKNETLSNQESFISKLQSVAEQVEEEPEEKFYSSGYENGKSKTAEERRANDSYQCDKCKRTIVKGSQYICLTIHGTSSQKIPKKLYGGRQYYRTIHSNATLRYHIGCYE